MGKGGGNPTPSPLVSTMRCNATISKHKCNTNIIIMTLCTLLNTLLLQLIALESTSLICVAHQKGVGGWGRGACAPMLDPPMAQMPRSRNLTIFVPATTTTTDRLLYPLCICAG